MNKSIESTRFRDLLQLLADLEKLHVELVSLIRAKIDAMGKNDLDSMQGITAREQAIAEAVREREGLRRQLMDLLGSQMGWPSQTARALSLSQLAGRVSDAQRVALLAAGRRLREVLSHMARANRVAGAVAREINGHLQWVFASVKPSQQELAGYSGLGGPVPRSEAMILDAIG